MRGRDHIVDDEFARGIEQAAACAQQLCLICKVLGDLRADDGSKSPQDWGSIFERSSQSQLLKVTRWL